MFTPIHLLIAEGELRCVHKSGSIKELSECRVHTAPPGVHSLKVTSDGVEHERQRSQAEGGSSNSILCAGYTLVVH